MFWSKARKIDRLVSQLTAKENDRTELEHKLKGFDYYKKQDEKIIKGQVRQIKELADQRNEVTNKLSDYSQKVNAFDLRAKAREILLKEAIEKMEAACEKLTRYEKELKQVRNAHVSYIKDLANLNVKVMTKQKKIEEVLKP